MKIMIKALTPYVVLNAISVNLSYQENVFSFAKCPSLKWKKNLKLWKKRKKH